MGVRAVLFDFAGTLLVPEPAEDWVAAVHADLGLPLPDDRAARLAADLVAAGRPGGPEPVDLPADLADEYARRDISEEAHRDVYQRLLGRVTGIDSELTRRLYEHTCRPAGWLAYPDSAPTLARVREAGVAVAVVSNVGFDLRAVFAGHGLADLVDVFVLSCEIGAMKPAAAPFLAACEQLAVGPGEALMVGDNPRADGGAVDLGISTLLLPYSPPGREHGLAAVLQLLG